MADRKSSVDTILGMADLGNGPVDELGSLRGNLKTSITKKISPTPPRSADDDSEHVLDLNISEVHPNPNQPRQHFDEKKLNELTASIKENGLISPILVRPVGKGYEIVAGERRYQASQLAGMTTIKSIVREMTDKEAFKISLTENLLREDLDPFEEAESYMTLQDEFGMTQAQIAETVQKSQPKISSTMRLITLPEPIRRDYSAPNISKSHLKELFAIDDPEMQIKVFQEMKRGDLSHKEVRALIKRISKQPTTKRQVTMTVQVKKKFASFYKNIDKDLRKSFEKASTDQKNEIKNILDDYISRLKKTRDELL